MSTKLSEDKGWCGDRTRGAGMGRPSDNSEPVGLCTCVHMPLRDGYDAGGAYWGCRKSRLYMIGDRENKEKIVIDACSRASAMKKYEDLFPGQVRWARPCKVPYDELVEQILPHYIETAMWIEVVSRDNDHKHYDEPFDRNHTFSDIGESAIESMRKNILGFVNKAGPLIQQALKKKDYDASEIGHSLWLHAFYDDSAALGKKLADQLQDAADAFTGCSLFINQGRTILFE